MIILLFFNIKILQNKQNKELNFFELTDRKSLRVNITKNNRRFRDLLKN